MTGARIGPYEVGEKLGEGGMGEVYRARDTKLDRDVALKVLPAAFTEDPDRLARFEREAKLLAQLHHPRIASIFGLEESSGVRALAMELVEGPTLAERLEAGALPLDEAVAVARQIAEALEAAHEKGIVHRDLKPQNVKLSATGEVKVLDFGLAKAMAPDAAGSSAELARSPTLMHSPTLTAAGTELGVILGTAAYMAPEQARGLPVDKRADLWALGVILFEMLAGRRLFEGEMVSDLLASVLRQEIDWSALPADTPPSLRRLLRRLLERNPKNRLHDAADARIVLADLAAGVADDAAPAPAAPAGRGRRELVAWALAALATVVAAGLFLGRPSAAPPPPSRVIRATLPLPAGVSIELDGERAGMPAISHDGTRIAVGAREGAGPMRIWVVDLATGAARPLPGTEEGYRPFWSPDDRTIGFFTWSHLSTTPAEGGAVRLLARARDARGGSWSPNGTILFAPHQMGPLLTIPEQGGEARVATRLEGSDSGGTHRFPSFLPDGERFVYLERNSGFGAERRADIVLGRLGSTEPIARLLEERSNAQVVGGRLLYERDGSLVAQSFDLELGTLVGDPRTLVGDLLVNVRFSYGVFSASPGVLAFLAGKQSDLSQLVWRDRSGRRLGELGEPGILSGMGGLALSGDGRWAAVSRIEAGNTDADISIYDLSRGAETRLARPGLDDYSPIFAPDSGSLVFGSREGSAGVARILRRDLRTGAERELLREESRYLQPNALTPEGEELLYGWGDEQGLGVFDLRLLPLAGGAGERTLIASPGDDTAAQLSPDGRWLAWSSDQSGEYEIYVAPFPGSGAPVQVSRAGGVQPRWNPRGGELFFKTPDNMLTAVPVESGSATFATGTPEPLFQIVEFLGWTYDVAPDGERFLVREPLAERTVSPITILTDWTSLAAGR